MFDANITAALQKAELSWSAQLKELRDTVIQQQSLIGELGAQTSSLNERQESSDKKTEYLETQREQLTQRLDNEFDSQRTQFGVQVKTHEAMVNDMKTFIVNCDSRFTAMHTSLSTEISQAKNHIVTLNEKMSTMGGGGQSSGSSGGKPGQGILDPKIVKLDTFAGDKKDRRDFTKWRKCLENHAETYYPGIKQLFEKIQRHGEELDVEEVKSRLSDAGLSEMQLPWTIEKVDHDLQVFLEYKTSTEAQSTCEAHEHGGFESYRQLNIEYDPVTENTKGALTTNIVSMMKRTAKTPKELKALVIELDKRVKMYKTKLAESPDITLVASVFTGMLDPETTKLLMQKGIYGNYAESKKTLKSMQVELADFGASDSMDLSMIEAYSGEKDEKPTVAGCGLSACTGCPTAEKQEVVKGGEGDWESVPTWVLDAVGKGKGKGKGGSSGARPETPCYNCGGKGHFARDCRSAYNPAAYRPPSGGGKSTWTKGGTKGDGKGGKGKGKAYSMEEQPWPQQELRSLGQANSFIEKAVIPTHNTFLPIAPEESDEVLPPPIPDASWGRPPRGRTSVMVGDGVIDPSSGELTCCIGQTCELCIRDNDPGRRMNDAELDEFYIEQMEWKTAQRKNRTRMPRIPNQKQTTTVKLKDFIRDINEHDGEVQKDNDKRRKQSDIGKTTSLSMLTERVKPGISAVGESEWKEFTATVDSGASEHVVPPTVADHVRLDAGPKKGIEYEVANGESIHNLGERRCIVGNDFNTTLNRINLQVTEVHKPLLSVARMVDSGQRVVFDQAGSYIEDTKTGDRIPVDRRGGIYEMRLWAKQYAASDEKPKEAVPFGRQR